MPTVDVTVLGAGEEHAGAVIEDGEALLAHVGLPEAELSVVLCDDATIRGLNRDWRGKDEPTDVLSFPQEDEAVLGDVVISVQTAERQAVRDVATEVRVLLVHGLLHLLGHDHDDDDEAAAMAAAELAALTALGTPDPVGLVSRARS